MENDKRNWLANLFKYTDEVVDAAQSPAAKLITTLLPIIAPLVPAFITGIRLNGMYLRLIGSQFPDWVATFGAIITATVLEMLGWVGTIALVNNLYRWIKTKKEEYLLPFGLSFFAYIIYIIDMWMVNSTGATDNQVFLWLSLFTVPAGFMFAVMLVTGQDDKQEYILRQERREDSLKGKMIKAGMNVLNQDTPQVKGKYGGDWRVAKGKMDKKELQSVASMDVVTIMNTYGVRSRRTAFQWKDNAKEMLKSAR